MNKIISGIKTSSVNNDLWRKVKRYKSFYLMMIPGILYYIIFKYIPMGGILLAFKEYYPWLGFAGSEWVGFRNFELFIQSSLFWQLFRNTVLLSGYKLLFGFPAPLILALLLNEIKRNRFKKVVQTITYFPHFISWVVIYTLLINMLDTNLGVVNNFISSIGLERFPFLAKASIFRVIIVLTSIWRNVGWGSIIYLAALSGIDPNLYEAADVDGANRWQKLLKITLPSIAPTAVIMLLLALGRILFVDFRQLLIFMGNNGSLQEVGTTYGVFAYRVLREGVFPLSYGVAVGLFQGFFGMILVVVSNYIANKKTGYKVLW